MMRETMEGTEAMAADDTSREPSTPGTTAAIPFVDPKKRVPAAALT